VALTLTKVLITMMRPNRKFKVGARMARMMKNAKNSDHGRLLQRREKALSDRRSWGLTRMILVNAWKSPGSVIETGRYGERGKSLLDYSSFWPDRGVSFRRLRSSCESR